MLISFRSYLVLAVQIRLVQPVTQYVLLYKGKTLGSRKPCHLLHELFAARFCGRMEEFKPLILLDFARVKAGGLQAAQLTLK